MRSRSLSTRPSSSALVPPRYVFLHASSISNVKVGFRFSCSEQQKKQLLEKKNRRFSDGFLAGYATDYQLSDCVTLSKQTMALCLLIELLGGETCRKIENDELKELSHFRILD